MLYGYPITENDLLASTKAETNPVQEKTADFQEQMPEMTIWNRFVTVARNVFSVPSVN